MTPVILNTYLYMVGINTFKTNMINKLLTGDQFFSKDEMDLIIAKINNDRYIMQGMENRVRVVKVGDITCALVAFDKVNMGEFLYRYLGANRHIDMMIAVNMATGGLLMTTHNKKNIDMNSIAKRFNGGGHKEVAGGSLGLEFANNCWEAVEKTIITKLS